jgi:hypothetical protein
LSSWPPFPEAESSSLCALGIESFYSVANIVLAGWILLLGAQEGIEMTSPIVVNSPFA